MSIFSEISVNLDWNSNVMPQHVGLLKLMLNYFCGKYYPRRKLCWQNCIEFTINILLCQDTYEPIHFKLGMLLDMTKLYSLISVWMTMMFTQGHKVMGKLELVQSFFEKLHEATVHYGWLHKGNDCEEVPVWGIWMF